MTALTTMTESELFAIELEVRNSTFEEIKAMGFAWNFSSKSGAINFIKILRVGLLATSV